MSLSLPPSEVRPLNSLVPYWRNPRRLSDEAVNAVAKSLEDYGYNQPIVVDGESVIIIGHTRYSAMRRLGVVEAPVVVLTGLSPEKVKQLRVLDNRAGEFSAWDIDALMNELSEADASLMTTWFPEITLVAADVEETFDWETLADQAEEGEEVGEGTDVEFVCPSCLHMWTSRISADDVTSGRIDRRETA